MMGPKHDDREPQKKPTREALVDLSVKPQSGASSAGPNLRRKRLSDRGSEGNAAPSQEEPARRPLADLTVRLPQPGDPSAGLNLRRKRLSDMEPEGNAAPSQPQTGRQCRRSLAPSDTGSAEPSSEPESSSELRRPRLVNLVAAPEAATPEGAAPEGQEPRPKVGRARVTITQAAEDPSGLQNIIDPPRSLSAVLAPGQGEIEVVVPNRPVKRGFSAALVGGGTGALAAALGWALITMATGYHAGWMAIGVGLLVGGAVRTMGRGAGRSFGYLGAAVWILGCLLGNFLSVCAFLAGQENLSPVYVLIYICSTPARIPGAMIGAFHFLDPLFWGAGIYAAYRLSFRRIAQAETADDDSGK
jgi:hypothetical protein